MIIHTNGIRYKPGKSLFDAINGTLDMIEEFNGYDEFKAHVVNHAGQHADVLAGRYGSFPASHGSAISYVQVRGHNRLKGGALAGGLRSFYDREKFPKRVRLALDDKVIARAILRRGKCGKRKDFVIGDVTINPKEARCACQESDEKCSAVVDRVSRALDTAHGGKFGKRLGYDPVVEAYNALAELGMPSLIAYGGRYSLSVLNGSTPVVDARSNAMYDPLSTLPRQQRRNGLTRQDVETVGEIWTALTDDNLLDHEWNIMVNKSVQRTMDDYGRESGSV